MTPSSDSSLESLASSQVSESPFPDQFMSFVSEESETEEERATYSDSYEFGSPFPSIYELESEEGIVDPETEEVMEFLTMSEAEIEAFIDQYETQTDLAPAPEYFWGRAKKWLKRKAKKAFKKAAKLAKRGFRAAKRYGKRWVKKLAMRALRKLKRLVKPLLKRVLKFAINKIPSKYRPLAKMLAKRFGLLKEVEEEGAFEEGDDTIQDISEIQREFDEQIANLLFAESEEEQEAAIAEYNNYTGRIVLYDTDNEELDNRVYPNLAEFQLILEMLRFEKPLYFDDRAKQFRTGFGAEGEPVGEEEGN